jgi:hypothetical protein
VAKLIVSFNKSSGLKRYEINLDSLATDASKISPEYDHSKPLIYQQFLARNQLEHASGAIPLLVKRK